MNEQQFLPLVSPRSPSYARARSEIAHGIAPESVSVAGLNRLVEAENDARRVCQYIASTSDDAHLRDMAVRLAALHAERQVLVGDLVRGLGGSPPMPDESRETLRFGPSYFEGLGLVGELMSSLRQMYAELRSEYLQQATELDLPGGIRHALHDLCPSPSAATDLHDDD